MFPSQTRFNLRSVSALLAASLVMVTGSSMAVSFAQAQSPDESSLALAGMGSTQGEMVFETWTEAMGLTPLAGTVTLGEGLAEIDLPADWGFLEGEQARFLVEEVWENPEDPTTLGFAYPSGDPSLLPDWGVIVSFEREGYVDDEDAASIDFDELMEDMQASMEDSNAERVAAGYGRIDIFGWAEAPHFDFDAKKIYWAKDLFFEGEEEHTLNFEVRVLGREGVLSLNAVASLSDLAEVREGSRQLLEGTHFLPGNTYADFEPGVDKLAAYGIGGLIAGNVLLKGGLLAKFGLIFAKGAKFIVFAAIAIAALVKKMMGRKK